MTTLIQLLALAAIALALYLVLLLLRTRPPTYSPRRPPVRQLNHAWIELRSALSEPDRPFRRDAKMDELISLCNGDRNTARRLADGAGSADRAIAQLLRDRR